jgi:hypothetical protein
MFLPGADTPFGGHGLHGFANSYFQAGRALYFGGPVLVGWGIGLIAARQRFKALWPSAGLVPIALVGCMARVHAIRTAVGGGERHVSLGFSIGPSVEDSLVYALVILSLAATPYLLWRLQNTLFYST